MVVENGWREVLNRSGKGLDGHQLRPSLPHPHHSQSAWAEFGVAHSMPNVPVSEELLDQAGVHSLIGEGVARCPHGELLAMFMTRLLAQLDRSLCARSGAVFYSGRCAFTETSKIYVLGLNPGGDSDRNASSTISRNITKTLTRRAAKWSAYKDEKWDRADVQGRILHMLSKLQIDPRCVPGSNVVFARTASENALGSEKAALLKCCWPLHDMVIQRLGVRLVLCLGVTAGLWVRERLNAHERIDSFTESNRRRWTSEVHQNRCGLKVATLLHPSRADWTDPKTDPSPMVIRALRLTHRERTHLRRGGFRVSNRWCARYPLKGFPVVRV